MFTSDPVGASLPVFIALVFLAVVLHLFVRPYKGARPRRPAASHLRSPWFLAAVAILAFLGTMYWTKLLPEGDIALEADMRIAAGQIVGVYINDLTIQPKRLAIVPNNRHVYRFEHIPQILKYLRIDPTNASDARITLYSVAIVSAGHVIKKFSPAELRSWNLYNLEETPGDEASLNLVSSDRADRQGDFIGTDVSLVAAQHSDWLLYFIDVFERPHLFSLVFIFCFLLFLVSGLSTRQGVVEAGLVAAVALVAYPLTILVSKIPVLPPAVNSAIGNTNYEGYPKFHDYLLGFVLLTVGAGLAWLASRYIPLYAEPLATERNARKDGMHVRLSGLLSPVVFTWLLMLYCPDLKSILGQFNQTTFTPANWDGGNFMLWDYLGHSGYLPFRDFWYPYSGFYTQLLPFPTGAVLAWIQRVLTLWFLYRGLLYVVRRDLATALLFVTVFLPVWLGELAGWYRYLLAIDVGLFYAAIQDARCLQWRRHLLFVVLVGFVFFHEPAQLIYAGVGMLVHTVWLAWSKLDAKMDLRAARAQVFAVVRQRFLYVGIPFLAGIVPVLVFLAIEGMLSGFIRFQLSLSDQTTYGSIPAPVANWTIPTLQFETMFLLLFMVVTLCFYASFRNRYPQDSATTAALVIGVAGFMAMQKQITRPPILDQVQVYPYVCALLYGLGAWQRRTTAQGAVAALFFGLVVGVAQYAGAFRTLYQTTLNAPVALAGDYDVVLHRSREIRAANATMYDGTRLAKFVPENAVIEDLKREFGWSNEQSVYVLGDYPAFYILLREAPPYVTNNYNCSPLAEQQRVLQWLKERRPRFVIWNPGADSYDRVPHIVRLPLIYQFVVENYRHLKTVGPYHVLTVTTAPSASDLLYWEQQLGTRLDLGHIPRLTKSSDFRDCPGSGLVCQPVLFVRFSSKPPPGKAVVTLDSLLGPFQLSFDMAADRQEYIIDLDRLWFRSFLGAAPHMTLSVSTSELTRRLCQRKSGVLY